MGVALELRPYQEELVEKIRQEILRGRRRILVFAPVGAGKTQIIIALMKGASAKGNRAIVFAHRRELVKQTAERFAKYGVRTTILMAGHDFDPMADLVVASRQTFERRWEFIDRDFKLVIFDEAHIGVEQQIRIADSIGDQTWQPVILGFTATPMTNSGPGLGAVYETLVHGPTISELTEQGYLVPAEHYLMHPVDFKPMEQFRRKSTGEYDEDQVYAWFKGAKIYGDIIQTWEDHFRGKPTIVFAIDIRVSRWIAEEFGKRGYPFAHVDFRTPEKTRRRIFEKFFNGEIIGLSNVSIVSEGFDAPHVEVVILATPIGVVSRYLQIVGRALRPAPGKEKAIIVDHGGVIRQHGTIYAYQLWDLERPKPTRLYPEALKRGLKAEWTRKCPVCGHEFKPGPDECPKCKYDFYHLPPGYEPPTIPAILFEYREAMRHPVKSCRPVKPPAMLGGIPFSPEVFYAQLLGWVDQINAKRKRDKKPPMKRGIADVIFYATLCECPRDFGLFPNALEPLPPGDWTRKMTRRYFTLRSKGYFEFAHGFPCWR